MANDVLVCARAIASECVYIWGESPSFRHIDIV